MRARLLATIALFAPAVARAAEEGHGEDPMTLLWHGINLLILIGVIVYFGRGPLRAFMADRRQNIEQGIASAQHELDSAEQRLAECNRRVDALGAEIEEIKRNVRAQAETERDRLIGDARSAAERIRHDARLAVEQEGRRAREELRAEAADMAVRLAADLLKRQVGDADRTRLVDEFVDSIESASQPAARS
jgi:F-type H+-transporting ATPase subunit b